MAFTERQDEILKILKGNKRAGVTELSKLLFVSEATIRRDLSEMQSMGLVERSHGGARLPDNSEEISMFFRMEKNATEKERLATKALPYIPPFKSVFIDSSSTAFALSERMELSGKTVVTNSLQAAIQLSKKPNVTLVLLGGTVQFNTTSSTGSWTARQLGDFNFDLMISSCSAVQGGVAYERSLDTREIKRKAFERSSKRMLLIDHTKFSAHGTYAFEPLSSYDLVCTDAPPPLVYDDGSIKFIY